ncbi:phosphopantetheine-binding protein [Streptomyces sp. NPDC127033]|uniref:phosphopantetheine-binding protein n=1 Tax=Streptomyces sp. NPDC127033 TaxID=3347110 RepID=UPI00365F2E2B
MPSPPSAPGQDTPTVIAAIWCDVLDLPQVDPRDNFFDLGGHSVLLHMVRDAVRERLGTDVPLVELFAHPTVHSLARHLDGGDSRGVTERHTAQRSAGRARLSSRRRLATEPGGDDFRRDDFGRDDFRHGGRA